MEDNNTVTDEIMTPRQIASKKEALRIASVQAVYLREPLGWQLCQEDCKNTEVSCWRTCMNCNERSMEKDRQYMHENVLDIDAIAAVEDNAEKFDQRTEASFKILQVFSACCVMFAHGSGEVGYMAGPLSTIWVSHNHHTPSDPLTLYHHDHQLNSAPFPLLQQPSQEALAFHPPYPLSLRWLTTTLSRSPCLPLTPPPPPLPTLS